MMNETAGNVRAGNPRTMNRPRRSWKCATAGVGLGVLALADPAFAADMPLKAPALKAVYDWTGFYVGAHAGFGRGSSGAVLTDPAASTTGNVFDGMIGGVQAGYNYRLASGFLLGVEADISLPSYLTSNSLVSSIATARSAVTEQWDYVATARGRVGYAAGSWLFYATGGLAWAGERFRDPPAIGDDDKILNTRFGWSAGGGVEYGFAPHWSVRLEYLYSRFERANINFPSGTQYTSSLDFQALRVGLNRKIDWPGSPTYNPKMSPTDPESDRWEIHGQSTFLPQGYPAFHAPYSGPNSLTPAPQLQETWQQPLHQRAAVGGRRGLLQSGAAARIWTEQYDRRRGISQRRSAEVRLPLSALQHLAAVPAPDLRLRRRAGRARQRAATTRRKGGRLAPDASGRQVCCGRSIRRQRLCTRSPQGFHELVDVGVRRIRLCRGQARPGLWRDGGAQPEAVGVARRLFPDGCRVEFEQFRYQGGSARRVCGRTRDALFAVLPAGQAAHHRLAQQRLLRKLSRNVR